MPSDQFIYDSKPKPRRELAAISLVIAIPFLAVLAAVPVAWGWGITWDVLGLSLLFYVLSMIGVSVGFHRLFTHRSFEAIRPLRIGLAIAGALAVEGPILRWVADHRRHHARSDRDGDPHSPWRYGSGPRALLKGMVYAHCGWFFDKEETNQRLFIPDLLRDRDVCLVNRYSGAIAWASLLLPSAIEILAGAPIRNILSALFWAGLVRIFIVHHVSWSVNSICHTVGKRPFRTRDHSANFWPLALLSMGDAWHNAHHAMPTYARHGVQPGQIDISAELIAMFERLDWATNVKWPPPQLRHPLVH